MLGEYAIAERALCTREGEEYAADYFASLTNPVAQPVHLVEFRYYDSSEILARYGDWHYITTPADALPNETFSGRALRPLELDQRLPLWPALERRGQLSLGTIEFDNSDGACDSMVSAGAVDGRVVEVRRGQLPWAYNAFGLLYRGTAVAWRADDATAQLVVRDDAYKLETPLTVTRFSGAGGANGTAQLAGKPRPLIFGRVLNVSATLIEPTARIYQLHARAMQAIDAVYDRGVALTAGSDFANYAALAAATVAGGTYATCLAEGYFRLGSDPAGLITADARGDNVGGYVNTGGGIVLRLALDFCGLALGSVDAPRLNTLAVQQPAEIGVAFGTEIISAASALDAVCAGINGFWQFSPLGLLQADILRAPDVASAVLHLRSADILSLERLAPPENLQVPAWRWQCVWQRNWTVQRGEDLAGSVTPTRRQFLAEAERLAVASDNTVLTQFLTARDVPPVATLFNAEGDASAEATRLLNLFKVKRELLAVRLKGLGFAVQLGWVVTLDWPRYGISASKAGRVVGRRIDAARNEVVLTIWWG